MDNPKVSVIIPIFNSEKFLKETIESVFAQTCQNWELLLVDDGSTDSSRELAISYTNQYPDQVRYLFHAGHQNKGASPSRNLGFNNSRGDIILFLDSDDILLPPSLETHLQTFEQHPEVDVVFGGSLFWYGWTRNPADQTKEFIWEPWKAQGIQPDKIIQPPGLLKALIKSNVMPCPSSLLVRRGAVDLIGGWPEDIKNIYDDHALCVKLFLKATVFIAPGWQEKYRIHEDSWIHNTEKGGDALPARISYLIWVKEYLSGQNYHDPQIEQYLNHELFYYQNPLDKSKIDVPLSVGLKNFGDLHRISPVSRIRGLDRSRSVRAEPGQPIDRYYTEVFFQRHSSDIQGQVMEIGDSGLMRLFGGDHITQSTVMAADHDRDFPRRAFDCLIHAQAFSSTYDFKSAIQDAYAVLKPGGILLVTLPGISQIRRPEMEQIGDYWRFTDASVKKMFGDVFGSENIMVETYGNVLAASALLFGLESHELKKEELDFNDPDYQVIIAVRAVKPERNYQLSTSLHKIFSIFSKAKR